ncbi:MAG TPA: cytochrome c biogenesis protein ResB [Pyrinomonadaceae bacterium]|nr:cytochrome c biogenesis protein ResB [Pyrinomonadaceae bacterium]
MAAAEETIGGREAVKPRTKPIGDRVLDFLSSVRFGVSLLCILVVLSMIGMLIIQQNVQGFDAYYASLTPAEKLVYGSLGFFDIYYSWYFKLLLLILSLNIILASIDRFPSVWKNIFTHPKLTATRAWLLQQPVHESIDLETGDEAALAEKIGAAFRNNGLNARISGFEDSEYATDESGKKDFTNRVTTSKLVVFGESGRLNRVGAYIVHVALLTLFLGHFVALQTGFDADVRMIPGDATDQIQMIQFDLDKKEKFNVQLPFSMTCTDIEQRLIDPRGSIDVTNTLDWRTQIKVDDPEYGQTTADISMNRPFSYRGYRFFQAQTIPVGNARTIDLNLIPQNGGEPVAVSIQRTGETTIADGTKIEYEEFLPDFTFNAEGKPDTRSGEYNNPVAILGVTPPQGERMRVFAFGGAMPDNAPVSAPKAGYRWKLANYEKAPFAHVLSIKYDPFNGAFIAWYFGGFGLIAALGFVFFFSHKRVWALIENDRVVLGGNTNRNHLGFEEKFRKIVHDVSSESRLESRL